MQTVGNHASQWLSILPESISDIVRQPGTSDPLYRFYEREIREGSRLLTMVRTDLQHVQEVCQAKRKQTNHL
eukprot:Awhi_evm1s1775